MTDRAGQVWTGVFLKDHGDLCLCLRTVKLLHGTYKHYFLDLETGEFYHSYERPGSDWVGADGRRRVA